MEIISELTGFLLLCWLLVSSFRIIIDKLKQFDEISRKIKFNWEFNQRSPVTGPRVKASHAGVKVWAHRNR